MAAAGGEALLCLDDAFAELDAERRALEQRDPTAGFKYPGTCRDLSAAAVRSYERAGRTGALRLRTAGESYQVDDLVAGRFTGGVDDVVLQRNDGVPAYNLAVVVDDEDFCTHAGLRCLD